ncbi:MAG: RNA-guided endonuclease IscB, partial [Candidatus Heimdallarchaeota archaeon]
VNQSGNAQCRYKVLADNIGEENQLWFGGQTMSVSVMVVNMRGQPLMPTTPRKARRLLKAGKAKVIQRNPFTIQLQYPTGEALQPITLGIDAGYSKIGFSALTEKQELIAGEVQLRMDISENLAVRRMYRRTRRSHKTRYRPPRFNNRTRSPGWLAPSIQHKFDSHLRLIAHLQKILPISRIIVEIATFDPQKMQNPEIKGVEYQQGELAGYEVREYLLHKWDRKCAYCRESNLPLEVEHIVPKSRGGSNRVSNLTMSCRKCNLKKSNKTAQEFGYPQIHAKAKASLKAAPFMNLVRSRLVERLACEQTWGYLTKYHRVKLELPKSHVHDAFVIAGGTTQERCRPYRAHQVRRNNRSIQKNRKGFKPAIRRQHYPLQPNDLVHYKDHLCRVKGVFNYGNWIRLAVAITGEIINTNIKNVSLVKYGKGFAFELTNSSPT